jgi:ABC-type branched-subunit amino acid transport system ATPase component
MSDSQMDYVQFLSVVNDLEELTTSEMRRSQNFASKKIDEMLELFDKLDDQRFNNAKEMIFAAMKKHINRLNEINSSYQKN